ncbi:MAG TPA: UDP-glucose/GDP-mannose dehydrogenase family protein [Sporichthyaceae bacterium]|nr:UDP-glucose/GDP-mannose dehydrogenase family protein [Sporichthyaceae bacterium]
MTRDHVGPFTVLPAQATAPIIETDTQRRRAARPRISVLGTGYLGATHAVCMASLGFEVIGLDVDEEKVAALAAGRVPFHEPGLPELLREQLATGRLRFTTSWAEVGQFADVHFVCVGTPQVAGGHAADLRYVDDAVRSLAPHLRTGAVVVGKSTVPAGTAARLAAMLRDLAPNADIELAWNPEFLREGFAIEDTLRPDRLVLGVASPRAEAVLRSVYAPLLAAGTPLVVTDWATAELVKAAANSFLATKISFINAMAELCEVTGGDVMALSRALGYDTRIGNRFLHPGLGFGGGCLPKDIRAFQARAQELGSGASVAFLAEVDAINLRCRERVVAMCEEAVGGSLSGRRIAALGAAFKPDSDDVRDSPALHVARELQLLGADVCVYDPQANVNAARVAPDLDYSDSLFGAVINADLVVVLTEWAEIRQADPAALSVLAAAPRVVDARNCLDVAAWTAAGWDVRAPGLPARRGASVPAAV